MRKLLMIFLLFAGQSISQDTTSIYFEFGSSKIDDKAEMVLSAIPSALTSTIIDSIQFIGYADSVGKWDSNVRLSLKRAKNTYKQVKGFFAKDISYALYAKGEGVKIDEAQNRRVDIVIFYDLSENEDALEIIENADPRCFEVDFLALQYSHVRVVNRKNKEYVYIEALPEEDLKSKGHYYVKEDIRNGNTVQRVRWKLKSTGSLWWKRKRYVTTIPKSSFDKYQFFTLLPAPCDGCSEEILTKDTIIMNVPKYYPDRFLMNTMQAKVRFFGGGQVKIRVPREYVNIDDNYYYGPDPYSFSRNYPLVWEAKRSKRKSLYYFTKVDLINNRMPYIKRYRMTTVCVNAYEGGGDGNGWNGCGGVLGNPRTEFQINVEPGVFYHNDSVTGYAVLGLSYTTTRSYTSLNAGLNSHVGFYGSASYRYHFFSFPFQALSPKNKWSSNTDYIISTYGRLYAGVQTKTSFNKTYQSIAEANLHLGLVVVNTELGSLLPRIYIQGGVGRDVLNRINNGFYPYAEMGVTFNIGHFFLYRNR